MLKASDMTMAKKILKKFPKIYFSDISDFQNMKKENHSADKRYLKYRSLIETCRANQNPIDVLKTTYVDKCDTKVIKSRSQGTSFKEVENTFENNNRKRNQIIEILERYGLTQFVIANESKLISTLEFYEDVMIELNNDQEFEDDIEW